VGQWFAGLSFNQGVGGSIPVDVSLSKTLNPELLPLAVYDALDKSVSSMTCNGYCMNVTQVAPCMVFPVISVRMGVNW